MSGDYIVYYLCMTTYNCSLFAGVSFQLSSRFRNNVDEKMRRLGYIGVGVSTVGQRLVDTITKTCVTFLLLVLQ